MRVNANLLVGTVAIVATGVILFMVFRKGKSLAAAVDLINPASPNNLIAKGADAITQTLTGDSTISFGSYLYDKVSGDDSGKIATAPTAPRASNVINLADYIRGVEQADQEEGARMRAAAPGAFDNLYWATTPGGAVISDLVRRP